MAEIALRPVAGSDLDAFFVHQQQPDAIHMAAFTPLQPGDRAAFDLRWRRILDGAGTARTVLLDGVVVGHLVCFGDRGAPEVTYWFDQSSWGRGVATAALTLFLDDVDDRPLHARVAAGNEASRRVLERCGFVVVGTDRGYANGRGAVVDETLLVLR
jgi:RimJ/RimL family protein N-acetyltransferase